MMSLPEVVGQRGLDIDDWLMSAYGMLDDAWQSRAAPYLSYRDTIAALEGQLETVVADPCYLIAAAILHYFVVGDIRHVAQDAIELGVRFLLKVVNVQVVIVIEYLV